MTVNVAYFREQGINCLVFGADHSGHHNSGRGELLSQLTVEARRSGLVAAKTALAFQENGRMKFYGTPDLTRFLARRGLPRWTHSLTV